MPEPLDAYQYLAYLRGRWRILALSGSVALALSMTITLLKPTQYTAVTRVVIDPPAGTDPRAAMAVSPIYLESLRTYELFALSDSLFERALQKFELRKQAPERSIESWKRQVLKVEVPRNTKILEIHATLPEPKKAHELAVFLAEETVRMNRSLNREADQELLTTTVPQLSAAHDTLEQSRADLQRQMETEPVGGIEAQVEALQTRRLRLEREMIDAESLVAEYTERANLAGKKDDDDQILQLEKARAGHLREQSKDIERQIDRLNLTLAVRRTHNEQARGRLKEAETAYAALETDVREARAAIGYRGERLRLIDPGVVPERPSGPNLPLNVMAALALAFVGSILYLTIEFDRTRRQRDSAPLLMRASARGGDD